MPNHCSNNLTITGDKPELTRLWNAIQLGGGEIKLTSLFPLPEELENTTHSFGHRNETEEDRDKRIVKWNELISRYGHKDWYEWALANWGTKWGDYDHYRANLNDDSIELGYMTAWGPFEEQFWHHVSKQFPTLTFLVSYDEPGMVFCGASCYRNGATVAEQYIDDYSQVLGEPDWDDQDQWSEWSEKLSDLLATLETAVFSEM